MAGVRSPDASAQARTWHAGALEEAWLLASLCLHKSTAGLRVRGWEFVPRCSTGQGVSSSGFTERPPHLTDCARRWAALEEESGDGTPVVLSLDCRGLKQAGPTAREDLTIKEQASPGFTSVPPRWLWGL